MGRQRSDDTLDVMDEPHIEHAIGLVQHEMRKSGKIDVALILEVEQSARRSYEYINTPLQRLYLAGGGDAAKNHGRPQRQIPPVRLNTFLNLDSQFARRCKNQRPQWPPVVAVWR